MHYLAKVGLSPFGIWRPGYPAGVTSTLVPLGVTEDNQHEVPPLDEPEQAGWFIDGPEPGEPGASIILGHSSYVVAVLPFGCSIL